MFGLDITNEYIPVDSEELIIIAVRHWYDSFPLLPAKISNKLGIRSGSNVEKYEHYIREMASFIRHANSCGKQVLFLPFMYNRDVKVAEDIINLLENTSKVSIIDKNRFAIRDYVMEICKAEMVVGMRLHSIILSIVCGKPFIALSYSQKVRGLLDYLGIPDTSIDIDEIDSNTMIALMDKIRSDKDEFVRKEQEVLIKFRELAGENYRILRTTTS